MNRPRCVGGLKHTPDPERLKGLFSPSPQVFEEDTRMSADLNNISMQSMTMEPPPVMTPLKQFDFLNNEESQSSIVSSNSALDTSSSSVVKRAKKKKMEVCVAELTDFNASTIAEYDWPPPKGCCPSKNRDTFMIQEQVALYLGIKSFKRKYPDLPRRAIDMEERNWLQEKGLVSEKMCDLGITAVWASDILDIMYADFYEKYEEYKEYIRQKHLREIEAKQKALGLNVGTGKGLQARDRAMLSVSKWNAYFNKTRKEERAACLDLQTFTVNVPQSRNSPLAVSMKRPHLTDDIVDELSKEIPEIKEVKTEQDKRSMMQWQTPDENAYPLALVPGQYTVNYRKYTPLELRSYPINTVLDDPLLLSLRHQNVLDKETAGAITTAKQLEVSASLNPLSDATTESAYECDDIEANRSNTTGIDGAGGSGKQQEGNANKYKSAKNHQEKRLPVRRSRRARLLQHETSKAFKQKYENGEQAKQQKQQKQQLQQQQKNIMKSSTKAATSMAASSCDSSMCNSSENNHSDTDSDSDSSTTSSATTTTTSNDSDNDIDATSLKCEVCQRTQNRNAKGMPELFIECYTCRRSVHPSCVEMPYRMVTRVRNYNWQCADCKCCIKCKRKQEPSKMLYCEQCDRGYHIYCLGVKTVPDGRWSCERCSICMRCGAKKPEGLPPMPNPHSDNSEKVKMVKHKKVKWINEYRLDHITKLREHCSMLCVPCARMKPTKRAAVNSNNNSNNNNNTNKTSSITFAEQQLQQQQIITTAATTMATTTIANASTAAATTTTTTTTVELMSSTAASTDIVTTATMSPVETTAMKVQQYNTTTAATTTTKTYVNNALVSTAILSDTNGADNNVSTTSSGGSTGGSGGGGGGGSTSTIAINPPPLVA